MRQRLNVKLLGYALGTTVLFTAATHLLHGYQLRRNASDLVSQASRAEQEGNLDQATEYLARYLGFVPTDNDALARYGLLLDKQATTYKARRRVFEVLQQVLVREPERDDIRRREVHVAMKLERFIAARDHLNLLLQTSPADPELERLFGECEEGNRQYAKAAEWFQKAIGHNPGQIDSYVRRASLLRHRLGDPQAADALMNEMVDEKNPQSFQAHLARARYFKEL